MRHSLVVILTIAALLELAACTKSSPSADDRNRAFLNAIPPDFPAESKQFLAACVQRGGVRSYAPPGPKYPEIVQKMLEAEAKGETELSVSNATWGHIEMLGMNPDGSSRPLRASYGSDWKAGYTIVPHLMPVPAQPGDLLPTDAKIVFRWVRKEMAAKTRYTALPPDEP